VYVCVCERERDRFCAFVCTILPIHVPPLTPSCPPPPVCEEQRAVGVCATEACTERAASTARQTVRHAPHAHGEAIVHECMGYIKEARLAACAIGLGGGFLDAWRTHLADEGAPLLGPYHQLLVRPARRHDLPAGRPVQAPNLCGQRPGRIREPRCGVGCGPVRRVRDAGGAEELPICGGRVAMKVVVSEASLTRST
jgi:hypothetical protein